MKCFTCQSEMKNINDIVYESVRIDWYKCPKCNSIAQVELHPKGNYIEKVIWERTDE